MKELSKIAPDFRRQLQNQNNFKGVKKLSVLERLTPDIGRPLSDPLH